MSATAINALTFLLLTIFFVLVIAWCVRIMARARSDQTVIERAKAWFVLVQMVVMAVVGGWSSASNWLAWRADPIGVPASIMEWLGLLMGFVATAAFLHTTLPARWWRADTRAALRRRAALRTRIRELAEPGPDPDDSIDDLDLLTDILDLEWLEEVAAQLATQSPPRRLSVAIRATNEKETGDAVDADP